MDQLDLYNDALLLLGQRQLADLTEDREPRHRLDGAYNRDAIGYCLELVQPQFASLTAKLDSPAAAATFDYSHTFPADYVSLVGVFSDARLDQEVNRYIIEAGSLLADYDTVYLRYITSDIDIGSWSPSFFKVVSAYLARETATRLSPDDYEKLDLKFKERVSSAQQIEAAKVPDPRSSAPRGTLTESWRKIYNDALQILGAPEITNNDDDSNRRVQLDRTLDSGLIDDLLEDTSWQFGYQSVQIHYDPSKEPDWGHKYALPKPADLHRLDGLYTDEFLQVALTRYDDHNGLWFCGYQVIYCQYISKEYLANPAGWPNYFRRLVAARMAKDAAPTINPAREERAIADYEERKSSAMSVDAMQSPPRLLADGDWTKSRFRGGYRGRPGSV